MACDTPDTAAGAISTASAPTEPRIYQPSSSSETSMRAFFNSDRLARSGIGIGQATAIHRERHRLLILRQHAGKRRRRSVNRHINGAVVNAGEGLHAGNINRPRQHLHGNRRAHLFIGAVHSLHLGTAEAKRCASQYRRSSRPRHSQRKRFPAKASPRKNETLPLDPFARIGKLRALLLLYRRREGDRFPIGGTIVRRNQRHAQGDGGRRQS